MAYTVITRDGKQWLWFSRGNAETFAAKHPGCIKSWEK